jgi:hypothetical protein
VREPEADGREESLKCEEDHSRVGNGWRPLLWDGARISVATIRGFAIDPPLGLLRPKDTVG